jgi:hypothetical protein
MEAKQTCCRFPFLFACSYSPSKNEKGLIDSPSFQLTIGEFSWMLLEELALNTDSLQAYAYLVSPFVTPSELIL